MYIFGDNRKGNNSLFIDGHDENGLPIYRLEYRTALSRTTAPDVTKRFTSPVGAEKIFNAEGKLAARLLLNSLQSLLCEKDVVVGLGPGRCGTMSLAVLLAYQQRIISHHESHPHLNWNSTIFDFVGKWSKLFYEAAFPLPILADTAFWYLPFVWHINCVCPKARFICMHRNYEDIVNSFMLKYPSTSPWTRMDSKHWNEKWERNHEYIERFPQYDLPKEEGCMKYVEEYYKKAKEYENTYDGYFRIFDINCLNSEEGMKEILKYCGLNENEMNCDKIIRTNFTVEHHKKIKEYWDKKLKE